MKTKNNLKGFIAACILAAVFLIGGTLYGRQQGDDMIEIGFIGPLTGSNAGSGEEQKRAIDIAVDEINKAGGINGKPLVIIYEDGKCDGKEAASAAQKLIVVDKVKIVLSDCSSEALAVAPIAEKYKVINMVAWGTNPGISNIGEYTFRNSYSDEVISEKLAEVVNRKYDRIAIITEKTNYAIGFRDSFRKYFKGEIIEEEYQPNVKDVRTQIRKILAKDPEAIFVNPDSPTTGLAVVQQLRVGGFRGQLYGNFFAGSEEVLKAKDADGIVFIGDPEVKDSNLKEKLLNQFDKKPDFEFAVGVTYDAIYILKQAIEKEGVNPDRIKDYLHELKDFTGVTGTYGFGPSGDAVGLVPSIKQIKDNKIIPYERLSKKSA